MPAVLRLPGVGTRSTVTYFYSAMKLYPWWLPFILLTPVMATPMAHVEAQLAADNRAVAAGGTFWLGVHLTMDPTYHTYWVNSGESGLPTTVKWTVPAGITVDALQWPCPEKLEGDYVYQGDVWLLALAHVPASFHGPLTVHAHVAYLSCHDTCTQGHADLDLTVAMAPTTSPGPHFSSIHAALARVPSLAAPMAVTATRQGGTIAVNVARDSIQKATFFPLVPLTVKDSAPQQGHAVEHGYELQLTADDTSPTPSDTLKGVLLLQGADTQAVTISIPIR